MSPERAQRTPAIAQHCCFRDAGLDDVDEIVLLVESAYRGDASRAGWTTEADLLEGQRTDGEAVRALILKEGSRVLLAERDGELLACAHLDLCPPDACTFGMFSVRPHLQGQGVGNALLRQCEQLARADWRCRAMRMSVLRQREDLIPWYERRGYLRTGESKPFPYGDARFGLPKVGDLEFVLLEKTL
jgi:ribosomal protein S18 acetylase RimI-like enzyme